MSEPETANPAILRITELRGDGIGPELEASVHQVADSLPLALDFQPIDWSLERRECDGDAAIDEAEASMRRTRLAIKYPTVTKTRSPNRLIRRRLNFSVIYRPASTIAGVSSNFNQELDLHIVRVATGGTYGDPGQLVGREAAVSIRMVERKPVEEAATYAFELARRRGFPVTSSSKYTIQRVTDGLFEEVAREVAERYPEVPHTVELFDALLAKVIIKPDSYRVVLVLNEYGDFLSDLASGLVGSLGTGASGNFSFDADNRVEIALFDPTGGTAPDIAGKNICNPTGMLLSFAMLLDHVERHDLGEALRQSLYSAIADGDSTGDLGGKLTTAEFTRAVIDRLGDRLAV
ncbi:MAG: isocitrate/isopropylmalate family dehydrogenase [Thermoanaerobaculia bacterium]